MFPRPDRNEVHLVHCKNGHHLSTDCWCEPVSIYWRKNAHGIPHLIVEHDDDTLRNHTFVLNEREDNPDWVTRTITDALNEENA